MVGAVLLTELLNKNDDYAEYACDGGSENCCEACVHGSPAVLPMPDFELGALRVAAL